MHHGGHPDIDTYNLRVWDLSNTAFNFGVLAFLGEGYGEAVKAAGEKQEVDALVKNIGNLELVARHWWECEDYDGMERSSTSADKYTVEEAGYKIIENRWYKQGDLARITSLDELRDMLSDTYYDGHLISLETPEQAQKREEQEELHRLDEIASQFASSCGASIGTMEFIHKLEEALGNVRADREDWNSGERRMEEWMDHRHAGGGSEGYFDDLNYVNGQYASRSQDLQGVFNWLERKCPLLMAKYREEQLAETVA